MSEERDPVAPDRRGCLGCLRWVAIVIVALIAVGVVVSLITDDGSRGGGTATRGLNAGPAEAFSRADVNHLEQQHVYVVRLDDGSFIALYDKSSKQQMLGSDCRVAYDETVVLIQPAQLPGFRGTFVEECEDRRAVWRADGTFSTGAGYGNLDRFETSIDADGNLIIDTTERTCTKSKGVPGIPPFEVQMCTGSPG
jgi:hypothetical protein